MATLKNVLMQDAAGRHWFIETARDLACAISAIAQARAGGSTAVTFSEIQPNGTEIVMARVHRVLDITHA